jgi:hypothetical protein
MGLLNNLFGKLFGNKAQQAEPAPPVATDYMARWDRERQERMQAAELRLKDWLVAAVREKGSLSFTWESGNDEAFVTFPDSNESNERQFWDLEEYITDRLEIPDAGEFAMTGSGEVYIDGNVLRARYQSTMKAIVDYDEENEQEIYSDEEQDSGDTVLFSFN